MFLVTWIDEICRLVDDCYSNEERLVTKTFTISELRTIVNENGNHDNWREMLDSLEKHNGLFHISDNWAITYNMWNKLVTMIPNINTDDYKLLTEANRSTTDNHLKQIISSLSPHAFELFIVDLLRNSKSTREFHNLSEQEMGVDFRAYYFDELGEKIRLIGEVKKWTKPVPEVVVDRLCASIKRRRQKITFRRIF